MRFTAFTAPLAVLLAVSAFAQPTLSWLKLSSKTGGLPAPGSSVRSR